MKDPGAIRQCGHHITSASVSVCLTGKAEGFQTLRQREREREGESQADSCQICSVNDREDGQVDTRADGLINEQPCSQEWTGIQTHRGGTGASAVAAVGRLFAAWKQ